MSENPHIAIIDNDERAREALRAFIETHSLYKEACIVCTSNDVSEAEVQSYILIGEGDAPGSVSSIHLDKPVRMGAIGDALERLLKKKAQSAQPTVLGIGSWTLDMVHNSIYDADEGENKKRLTEKEKEILVFLHNHTGQSVSREDLLNAVWGYAKDIETHTLETHIYRLRQKIEEDPASPQILLTTEAGYVLVSEG